MLKMSEHPIQGLIETAMQKLREMVDVQTIIGDPISVNDATIIPVSKVSFGFASGGSDLPTKIAKDTFAGGSGGGVSISPIAFIVIANGDVKLLQMSSEGAPSNALINLVPEVFDKISSMVKNKEKKDKEKSKEADK